MNQNRPAKSSLGPALSAVRVATLLSQSDAARQAGCDRTTVVAVEAGQGSTAAFLLLAGHFGYEIGGRSLPPGQGLGERLAALRARRGISRRDLAVTAAVSATTIAALEGGEHGHLAVLERIGSAVGAGLRLVRKGDTAGFWMTAAVSSTHCGWTTPPDLLERLYPLLPNRRFCLDPCSPTSDRRTAPVRALLHYTIADDGLSLPWHAQVAWLNPPYGKGIAAWVEKARSEVECGNATTVLGLLPTRSDTRWWHSSVARHADVWHLPGRLRFGAGDSPAPFGSALIGWGADDAMRMALDKAFHGAWRVGAPA